MATFTEDRVGMGGVGLGGDGGGLGLIALLALLGIGGRGFGNNNSGVADAAVLANLATKDDLSLQTLGDIKASIPFNEAQVQLALQGVLTNLTQQNTNNTQYLSTQNTAASLAAATNAALITRDIAAVDTNVDRQSTAIQVAIQADGEKTRALITANTITDLQQRLTVAQLENAESRAINREQNNSHNVTTTINTNQQQAQLQQQQQGFLLNQLVSGFGQLAKATNSNVVVGSTGVGTQQNANPTNVNA